MDLEQMIGMKKKPPVELKKFLNDYKTAVEATHLKLSQPLKLSETMSTDEERITILAKNCSIGNLDQSDDPFVEKFIPGRSQISYKNAVTIPVEAMNLETFTKISTAKEKSTKNPFHRSRDSYMFAPLPEVEPDAIQCDFFNDIIVTIRVYRPARATHVSVKIEKPVFAEEFECLGSNTLSDFRDKISCVCNRKKFFDISENPDAELPEKETDPAYFFITDTFYNDQRNPDNPDYSKTILDWAKSASAMRNVDLKVAKMEETYFRDLTVNLGFPQLYQHHGNCEHVFTFSQIQVITPASECIYKNQYPRLRSFSSFNNRLCNLCGSLPFNFIVEESDRQLHDPAYICRRCFLSFHYIDGKKIGQFKAYRVRGESVAPCTDVHTESESAKESSGEEEGNDALVIGCIKEITDDDLDIEIEID